MSISKKQQQNILLFGAIAGISTGFLMKFVIIPLMDFVGGILPSVNLKLGTSTNGAIAINIRESLTGINTGFATWLTNILGITVTSSFIMDMLMAAIGGAILVLAGAYLVDIFNMLHGNTFQKTRNVIFAGTILATLVVGGLAQPIVIGLNTVNLLIAVAINAIVISWTFVFIDKQLKLKIIPF